MARRLMLGVGIALLLLSEVSAVDKARLRWARSKPKIDSIHIEGNQYFTDRQIKKQLYSRERNLWLGIKGDRRSKVQRETLGRDTLEVKYLYISSGFLGAIVHHSIEPIGSDSVALIRVRIDEGNQYRYGDMSLSGTYDRQYHVRFREIISKLEAGLPVNVFELKNTESDIKAFLANRGYPYSQVAFQVDTTGRPDSCQIAFEVHSDSLVHFGNVRVIGADQYPESVGRRELKIKPGKVYRRDDILESQRRLFESGYYSTFLLRRDENTTDRLNPDFILELRERKPSYLVMRTGASKSELRDLLWDISFGVGSRNSFGLMGPRRLEAVADYTFSAGTDRRLFDHQYRLRLTEPWFFGIIRMPTSLVWEWQPTIKDAEQDFDKRAWSISAFVTKWFGRQLRVDIGGEYENVKLSGITEDSILIVKEVEGISARRKLYLAVRRDSRDDLFIPTRGSVTEFSGDFYGGFLRGDADFFKLQASWSRYRRVWPGWIWATRIRGSWAEEFGQTAEVPLDEALYLGGASTVRGFEENKLGPLRDEGTADETPEGARYTVVFNAELRWRTVQLLNVLPLAGDLFKKFPLWQTVFVDVGNGFRNKEEMRFENLAVSYGLGFQIVSPAGPIRIDYAEVLEHDDFDFAHRWHFTILYAF